VFRARYCLRETAHQATFVFGIEIKGTVLGSGVYDGVSASAIQLGVPGGGWSEGSRHGVSAWHLGVCGDDAADREALFALLERDVLPCWSEDHARWLAMVAESLDIARRRFSADRMLESYYRLLYDPCLRRRGAEETPGTGETLYDAT